MLLLFCINSVSDSGIKILPSTFARHVMSLWSYSNPVQQFELDVRDTGNHSSCQYAPLCFVFLTKKVDLHDQSRRRCCLFICTVAWQPGSPDTERAYIQLFVILISAIRKLVEFTGEGIHTCVVIQLFLDSIKFHVVLPVSWWFLSANAVMRTFTKINKNAISCKRR